jgi:hypothetical protein
VQPIFAPFDTVFRRMQLLLGGQALSLGDKAGSQKTLPPHAPVAKTITITIRRRRTYYCLRSKDGSRKDQDNERSAIAASDPIDALLPFHHAAPGC